MKNEKKESVKYDILDLTKFILSIMIVAIHTELFPKYLYPWLRLAVPLFLIISSFFLFTKINNSNKEEEKSIIKKFTTRQLYLYLFWFIVLLPLTIYYRRIWFDSGLLTGIHTSIKESLFSSTFIASWFITALITGSLIVYFLSKKINYKFLLCIFIIINIICCIVSSYSILLSNITFFQKISDIYSIIFPSPVFSFPVTLFYILIGKLFADGVINIKSINLKTAILFTIISCALLYIEYRYVIKIINNYNSDCYVLLMPTSTLIFYVLLNIKISVKNSSVLRKISTITFPLHASIAPLIRAMCNRFMERDVLSDILVFILTLTTIYIICFIIFKLEDKKGFRILKYSH